MGEDEFKYGKYLCLFLIFGGIVMFWGLEGSKIISLIIIAVGIFLFISGDNLQKKEKARKSDGWIKIYNYMWVNEAKHQIEFNKKVFNFNDITASELIENENTISITESKEKTKGKSISQKHIAPIKGVVGATVGGIIGGPLGATAGAIVGGTTGKINTKYNEKTNETEITNTYDICNSLMIKVTLNSLTNPCEFVKFINSPIKKNSFIYTSNWELASKCQSVFEKIIKANDEFTENEKENN